MKIVIFGATGKTGRLVLDRLLSQGHFITVLVRTPAKLDVQHSNLHIEKGDVLLANDVATVVRGQDAVVSLIGSRTLKPDPLCALSATTITEAMAQQGVQRLVSLSGSAMGDNPGLIMTILRHLLLKNLYAGAVESDAIIQQTDLDWTIVRPYRMNGGPLTRNYQISPGPFRSPRLIRLISREDVADFLVRVVQEGTYSRQTPYLSRHGS